MAEVIELGDGFARCQVRKVTGRGYNAKNEVLDGSFDIPFTKFLSSIL